ncbi:thioredoxin domain-containing protein [Paenibacillus sp. JX-17]|uniref:Thioredoxin domain-containing protein n=1 Tax=Paenibacillus lacisoli TaxID=3064525 RepID=A0ABT9CDX0_9BACL|nr:thioredoxin domain-containing protein [Paenibacillus sp. JX-17]MDO7905891.1 thioredoxin domain-containing protein [Paenibacillus sp. JX-17]
MKSKGRMVAASGIVILLLVMVVLVILFSHKSQAGYKLKGLELERQPSLGSPDAKVKIVMFGAFDCPDCQYWATAVLPRLKTDYIDTGRVQFYFINTEYLIGDGYEAALAGQAIASQSTEAFWKYYAAINL